MTIKSSHKNPGSTCEGYLFMRLLIIGLIRNPEELILSQGQIKTERNGFVVNLEYLWRV